MTEAMVDRFFWRTGFGPTEADRSAWTGKSVYQAVNAFLELPGGTVGAGGPSKNNAPLAPTEDDVDLVLAWADRMIRAKNPLVERLTFFWHRHFATQRSEVSPPQLMMKQNELFRRYGDLASNPDASFRGLLYEVGEDPAMLRFLTGEDSTKRAINENYAREIMELFALGIYDDRGNPNYSETDVKELARAFTGWQIYDQNPDRAYGYFNQSRWDPGVKTVLGKSGAFRHRDGVDVVFAHPSHPRFLLTKLWGEFIVTPPPKATMDALVATYTASGGKLAPVLRKILLNPLLFESIAEPNMIKPPVVHVVGMFRALGLGITDQRAYDALNELGQLPYFPPTVAGWEGGASWLNTNSALGRFRLANRLVNHPALAPQDSPGETPDLAFTTAHKAVGRPWLASGTQAALKAYAARAPAAAAAQRRSRQIVLRALMLGGPDAQVM
jgi:uncharacterized protein (DUF1800 family)